jgi:hypothetical protein
MRQALRHPARIRLVGLMPKAPPHLLRVAHPYLHRAYQVVVDRTPIDPGALQRADRALLLGQPRAQGEHGIVGGRKLADLLGTCPSASTRRRQAVSCA